MTDTGDGGGDVMAFIVLMTATLVGEPIEYDESGFHVHESAGLLKQFLRSLPDPLLTEELYDDFIKTAGNHQTLITITLHLSLITITLRLSLMTHHPLLITHHLSLTPSTLHLQSHSSSIIHHASRITVITYHQPAMPS